MAQVTTSPPSPGASIEGVIEGIGEFGGDVLNLTSLQAQLAAEDLRECGGRAVPGLIALAIAIPLAIAGFTVALVGLAYWLAPALGVSLAASFLICAAGGLLTAALVGYLGVRSIRSSTTSFRRSREELERNLAWLGSVVMHSGR
ncbi:MAG: phage holin family protein [Isosphaeraceae bacterium]